MKRIAALLVLALALAGCGIAVAGEQPIEWHARATCTTNATGHCTQIFAHPLGVVPVVQVTPEGLTAVTHTYQISSASFRVRVMRSETQPYANRTLTLALSAFAPSVAPTPSPSVSVTPPTTEPTTPPTTDPPGNRACPPFPAFPDASCTGVIPGTVLRSCPNEITTAGTVLTGCLFTGGLTIAAAGVQISNSKVLGMVAADYRTRWNLSGLTLTDVEIDGSGYVTANGESAIGYDNYTCVRCNVHHTGRGFNFANGVTIRDSWAHDFWAAPGAHQSAAGNNGGTGNQIIHNNLDCSSVNTPTGGAGCSGALVLYGDFAAINDVTIQHNLFNGGSYCLYPGADSAGKPYPNGTNIRVLDNRFGRKYPSEPAGGQDRRCGYYGPVQSWKANAGNVWSGNEWIDGGAVNP